MSLGSGRTACVVTGVKCWYSLCPGRHLHLSELPTWSESAIYEGDRSPIEALSASLPRPLWRIIIRRIVSIGEVSLTKITPRADQTGSICSTMSLQRVLSEGVRWKPMVNGRRLDRFILSKFGDLHSFLAEECEHLLARCSKRSPYFANTDKAAGIAV